MKHCPYNDPKAGEGSRHGMAKLTEDDVCDIRSKKNWFMTTIDWGKMLKVHHSTIAAAKRGKTWKHVSQSDVYQSVIGR